MLVDGGTIHLWYVPFLLVASILVYPVSTWMRADVPRKWFVADGLSGRGGPYGSCAHLMAFSPFVCLVIGRFQEMTAERWSAVYWGTAAAILWTTGLALRAGVSRLRLPVRQRLIGTTAWQWEFGLSVTLKVYGGLGLLFLAMAPWKNAVVAFLAPFGACRRGFISHTWRRSTSSWRLVAVDGGANLGWPRDVAVFVGAAVLAFGTVSMMAAVPGLQWLAGYDDASGSAADAFTPVVAEDPG